MDKSICLLIIDSNDDRIDVLKNLKDGLYDIEALKSTFDKKDKTNVNDLLYFQGTILLTFIKMYKAINKALND